MSVSSGRLCCAKERNMNKILFAIGLCFLIIPIGIQFLSKNQQEKMIATFEQNVRDVGSENIEEILASARAYNCKLFEEGWLDEEAYWKHLVFDDNQSGIMGSLSIPNINCKLAIRHGTEKDTLVDSVGHVMESSLPVGGNNTHCVLSGHRGLPGQELFTRLDELTENDFFYLKVGGRQMTYRVCRIQTVLPDEVNAVAIEKGRDLVSLVTCTPYGLNTHRLVVTGERIPEDANIKVKSVRSPISKWNLIPCMVAAGSLFIGFVSVVNRRNKRKERKDEQHRNTDDRWKKRKTFLCKGRKHVQWRVRTPK